MNNDNVLIVNEDSAIDFKELFFLLWDRKFFLSSVALISSIAAVLIALSLPNFYTSSSLLSISSQENQTSSLIDRYSGLAAMAGISLPSSGGENKSDFVVATLTSKDFFSRIIEADRIRENLMAVKEYDIETNQIIYDPKKFDVNSNKWVRKVSYPKQIKPSNQEVHKYFIDEVFSVNLDKLTGYLTLSIEHKSPSFSRELLELIIKELNISTRERDLIESENAMDYLRNESINTTNSDLKESIINLMQSQLETQMMASVSKDYILRIIDAPFTPELKSRPNRALLCILIVFLSMATSIIYILSRHFIDKISRATKAD